MDRGSFLVLATIALSSAAACGTFLALDGDDGAPATDDRGSRDAGDDRSTNGDGSTIDVDAGGAACTARFCSSFDDDAGPDGAFNWKRIGPQLALDPDSFGPRNDTFVSPPQSLRITTANELIGVEKWLELTFADALSASVQLSMRLDDIAQDGSETLQFLTLNCDGGGDASQVHVASDGTLSIRDKNGTNAQTAGKLPMKQWTVIRLDFVKTALGSATVTSALRFAGGQAQLSFDGCEPDLKVRLGATSKLESFDVSFDDVAIDWRP